jgi:hypothetical protein
MDEKDKEKLSIDQVYDNYVYLYKHLDNLRWSFLVGIFALIFGIFSAISQLCRDPIYLYPGICVGFIAIGYIIDQYNHLIKKFVDGQDFICFFLADVEERNKHIFSNTIYSPTEEKYFTSFFNRRKESIKRDVSEKKQIKFLDNGVDNRSRNNIQNLLKNVSSNLIFIGVFMLIM